MPRFKTVASLYQAATMSVASLLERAVFRMDTDLSLPAPKPKSARSLLQYLEASEFAGSDVFCCCGGTDAAAAVADSAMLTSTIVGRSPEECLTDWLLKMPLRVLEDVVKEVSRLIESTVTSDKDYRIVMTLLNIERMRPSDLSFGVCSLISCLARTGITKLLFSSGLWYNIYEYDQLATESYLRRCLTESVPKLNRLVALTFSYMANDHLVYMLSRHCPDLEELVLDNNSYITDRSAQFFGEDLHHHHQPGDSPPAAAWPSSSSVFTLTPSSSSVSSSSSTTLSPLRGVRLSPSKRGVLGFPRLRYLSLRSCVSLSDKAVWHILRHKPLLQFLRYHEAFSVAEILCLECAALTKGHHETETTTPAGDLDEMVPRGHKRRKVVLPRRFSLKEFVHPHPYGLSVRQGIISQVARLCPDVSYLNLVTVDEVLGTFAAMRNLSKVRLELVDCLGMGLYSLLQELGSQLDELTLGCGSDVDSTLLDTGGQSYQLFNVGLELAARFCPNIKTLTLQGCGLVSNPLMEAIKSDARSGNRNRFGDDNGSFQSLTSLRLENYDSEVQSCERHILLSVLRASRQLETLSVEGNFSTFFSDSFIDSIWEANPMPKLRAFEVLGNAPLPMLTRETAYKLMNESPDLKELSMGHWAVSDTEFQEMIKYVQIKGWELSLARRASAEAPPENDP